MHTVRLGASSPPPPPNAGRQEINELPWPHKICLSPLKSLSSKGVVIVMEGGGNNANSQSGKWKGGWGLGEGVSWRGAARGVWSRAASESFQTGLSGCIRGRLHVCESSRGRNRLPPRRLQDSFHAKKEKIKILLSKGVRDADLTSQVQQSCCYQEKVHSWLNWTNNRLTSMKLPPVAKFISHTFTSLNLFKS